MTLNIPTVTLEDLASFHSKHFDLGVPRSTSAIAIPSDSTAGFYATELDDDLGYYSDGVKRTLTAEQVAMFRHSEVQRLLKQRRQDMTKRKQTNMESEGRKKPRTEPSIETEPVPITLNRPISTEAMRHDRLQAALWASQKEWPQPTVDMPSDTPRKEVQEVEVKGRSFLWPKIDSE